MWPAWLAAGGAQDTAVPAPARGNFEAGEPIAQVFTTHQLAEALATRTRMLVDARLPERYRGEQEPIDPVAGHIPGARNRPWTQNLAADQRFKDAAQLRQELLALIGTRPATNVVFQCGSGVTACHHLLAMELAGLPGASLYAGSWSEWIADPARPVATGAQP
jgi:thiosulfate/3-mercaptopyruvate sulfurtransferase